LLKRFELEEAADRTLATYSGGMRRRLDLAASLVINPKVLFLDEPTTGLDPRSRFVMWRVIRDLVEAGTSILLTTQYMEEADQLAHHILVMNHGKIIAQGTAEELKQQIGGDVLELHLANHQDAPVATELIKQFGNGEARPDSNTGIVTMPVQGGASVLIQVIRQLDAAHLKISDIILRRPTMDDVFIKLTGHEAK
jgi:ABC-2 type transport system ATP-binding protein